MSSSPLLLPQPHPRPVAVLLRPPVTQPLKPAVNQLTDCLRPREVAGLIREESVETCEKVGLQSDLNRNANACRLGTAFLWLQSSCALHETLIPELRAERKV